MYLRHQTYTLYYRDVYILVFLHVFAYFMLLRCMLKFKRLACGSDDVTQYNTIQLVWNENFSKIISSSGWAQSCTSNLKCPKTFLTYDVTYKKGKIQNQKNCIIADLKTCQVFSGFDIFSGLNKLLP